MALHRVRVFALLRSLVAACLVALAAGGAAQAAEEILSFDVTVEVLPDGALEVTEEIRVRAEGSEISRGIYRDFPVQYREESGAVSVATFEVLEVRRNGEREPYTVLDQGADKRLRIGDADVFLRVPSEQLYVLRYRTEGQLRVQPDFDELFWNVTGNDWAFPILAASVQVTLPDGVPILRHTAYTGPRGARGQDYEVLEATGSTYRARTTARLSRGEGFSVAVAWPKGAITIPPPRYTSATRPPRTTASGRPLTPAAGVLATLIGALLLTLGWSRVGRDPKPGAIYPRFDPPKGLSPAATRYVRRAGFDRRCLTAAILSMAVKGVLRIEEKEKTWALGRDTYTLTPLGSAGKGLSHGESGVYAKLFPLEKPVTLTSDKTNGKRIDAARSELSNRLWTEHYGASFKRNTLYTLGGVLGGILAAVLLLGLAGNWNVIVIIAWAVPALAVGIATLLIGMALSGLIAGRSAGFDIGRVARVVFLVVGFVVILGSEISVFGVLAGVSASFQSGGALALAGSVFGVVAALFHFLMAAPSKAGRDLLDQIEGFEMYMAVAEEDRLNILNPPEKTPELFEQLLPYAVGLGLTHEWSQKFAGVLSAANAPGWYQGNRMFDADRFDSGFGHAVASTSAPSSRSSSGFSGGGGSGGGGGGGGGGGW
ncbi:DUF2207 domain-containing protein [Maliponia aquimaris]|uniref:DUF2207 domain-containing protein n=1 Tax=Maliponia aquimaris TaxID=1673631 RepID=A0A238KYS7_9RHOB|nr:DUF2207 domain-containing protein [Maliponia aquimaris]SMX47877.1 hypothetical protein MAA8898_03785 [Maliponia aquimaris]